MKANAPEKLYITNDEKRFSDKCHSASTEKYVDDDIEYIRTDAFIKKALKFIKTNVDRIVNNQRGVCMGCMDVEFRNYMKGE